MIIFLYGPDDYRREEKKRWYISEFKKKYSGLSVESFDFSGNAEDSLSDLKNFIRGQSIFEDKKLAVLRDIYEADEKKLKEVLSGIVAEKATIVLCSEKSKPNKALGFLLEKPSTAENFDNLSGYELEDFIKKEAKKLEVELALSAVRFLSEVYINNTWGLVTELQKIGNLKSGAVAREDLNDFGLEAAPNYWAIMSGFKGRDLSGRLVSLERMFAAGEPMPKLFNILASQWREKIPQMAEYDLLVKSGKLEYEETLLSLVFS